MLLQADKMHKITSISLKTVKVVIFVKIVVKIILNFTEPLQSCCCPVQKNLPRKAELAWQISRYLWRGSVNSKIKDSIPLLSIILSKKCQCQDSRFYSTYKMSPSRCATILSKKGWKRPHDFWTKFENSCHSALLFFSLASPNVLSSCVKEVWIGTP